MALDKTLIEDFNYVFFNPKIDSTIYPQRSVLKSMVIYFAKLAREFFFDLKSGRFLISIKDVTVFYVTSDNDFHPLDGIYQNLPPEKKIVNIPQATRPEGTNLPLFLPTLISFFFIPHFLIFFFFADREKKIRIRRTRNDLLLTYGYYYYYRFILSRGKPKGVVLANDHTYHARILIHLCNEFGVKSFYVQHASVTDHFPKLTMTYALLEGNDAMKKYVGAGSDPTKIKLIGMIKLDKFIGHVNIRNTIKTIGYAASIDKTEQLISDLRWLKNRLPDMRIVLRPHPWYFTYMKRKDWDLIKVNLPFTENLILSDPRQEHAFDYLSRLDLLVAGDSSIHLEAVLLNVMSIYYDNRGEFGDFYGYAKNNLCVTAKSIQEVAMIVEKNKASRPYIRDLAKNYVHFLGTPNEGRSALLASEFIKEALET